jgi:hypothetical protein
MLHSMVSHAVIPTSGSPQGVPSREYSPVAANWGSVPGVHFSESTCGVPSWCPLKVPFMCLLRMVPYRGSPLGVPCMGSVGSPPKNVLSNVFPSRGTYNCSSNLVPFLASPPGVPIHRVPSMGSLPVFTFQGLSSSGPHLEALSKGFFLVVVL